MLTALHLTLVHDLLKVLAEPQKEAIKRLLEGNGITYEALSEALSHPSAQVVLEAEINRTGVTGNPTPEATAKGTELVESLKPKPAPAKPSATPVATKHK